jgi:DNA mismatch repair protein MutL
MAVTTPSSRRIHILRDEVSRKIAAGEVIDRPFSIVRELLDNAIDAGARAIDVHLEAGGLSRVRVVDDGAGMSRADMEVCWQPHATSKIETEDDLLLVTSLGFRGEALSSIAVCSRLVVVSCQGAEEPACRLEVVGGSLRSLEASQGRPGTVVDVSELFFNYPARKKFLRSVSSESGLCRSVFVDRAAAHPAIAFRLFTDGEMKLSLPAAGQRERIGLAYSHLLEPSLLVERHEEGDGFLVTVVGGSAELRRRDRKLVQVFVNRRRVTEFSLVQAAEYGYAGWVPGGWHPVAFVLVDIDPGLIDFNIHPAKKEVRFRNLPEVHKAVVAAARMLAAPAAPASAGPAASAAHTGALTAPSSPHAHPAGLPWGEPPGGRLPVDALPAGEAPPAPDDSIRYLGQVFGVFLLFELPGRLLMVDQHAAHERIIFERLMARAPVLQELLFPLSFDVSDEEEGRITAALGELLEMGVSIRRAGARVFEVTALSAELQPLAEERLVEMLRGVGAGEWQYALRAGAACRLAIKEGDRVDALTARELCAGALKLPVARCPHGRPIWHELTQAELLRLVDRPAPR